jgi:hypothetical protein
MDTLLADFIAGLILDVVEVFCRTITREFAFPSFVLVSRCIAASLTSAGSFSNTVNTLSRLTTPPGPGTSTLV